MNINEAPAFLKSFGIADNDAGIRFQGVDKNTDGKMSLTEWEEAGNMHPPLALRIITFSGSIETHIMETADFGPNFRHEPGIVYSAIIEVADPVEACGPLVGQYTDRIVLTKRGTCEFCIKAKSAQDAGAKAIIVANNDETVLHMTFGTCGQDVNIPSIMVPFSVGEELQKDRYTAATVVFPICLSGSNLKPGFGVETCDDGNTISGDGCSSLCMSECGNGILSANEECDDGNQQSFDGCSAECSIEPGLYECSDPAGCRTQCGDGFTVEAGCFLSGDHPVMRAHTNVL